LASLFIRLQGAASARPANKLAATVTRRLLKSDEPDPFHPTLE
jgi:hypothetical protein